MKLYTIATAFIFAIAMSSFAVAKPFLGSDPSKDAVGGRFEVLENGVVIHDQTNQPDGSIRWDLAGIAPVTHHYTVRYVIGSSRSDMVPVTIRGTRCYIFGPDGKGKIIQRARTKCLPK